MGTTLTAFKTDGETPRHCLVLVIGGYDKLITDLPDPSDLFTGGEGWDGTPWSSAIGGLRVQGQITSTLKPWADKLDIGRLVFAIKNEGEGTDDLEVFHAPRKGIETWLDSDLDANDTIVTVRDTGLYGATGTIYLDGERIDYAAKIATAFGTGGNPATRGMYQPFATHAGTAYRYGRDHKRPTEGEDVEIPVSVTDEPRWWCGRHVALWVHRIHGGKIDTVAQAHLLWSGKLTNSPKDTSSGETAFTAEDSRAHIKDTTLHYDQFTGVVKEGVYLRAGDYFDAKASWFNAGGTIKTAWDSVTPLTATVGAAVETEIEAGWTTVEELISALNEWLRFEATAGHLPGDEWSVAITSSEGGARLRFLWQPSTGYIWREFYIKAKRRIWRFLGFDGEVTDTYQWRYSGNTNGDPDLIGDEAPYRVYQTWYEIDLDWSTGTWFNNREWLPEVIQNNFAMGSDNWGILDIGGSLVLVRYNTDTNFSFAILMTDLMGNGNEDDPARLGAAVRYDQEGEIVVKQVVLLCGSLFDVVMRILASTGATGYNHATYDVFPRHLGAAIPWALLSEFATGLEHLAEATTEDTVMVVLEKPTKLEAKLMPELALRGNANIVMKNGLLRIATTQTPFTAIKDHDIVDADKGTPGDVLDPDRTPAEQTMDYSANVIKLLYNREMGEGSTALSTKYRSNVTLKAYNSINKVGPKPKTIKAPNSFAGLSATGDTIKGLIVDMVSWTLPNWSMPLLVLRRSIRPHLWLDVAPGDIVELDDAYCRDPDTGARGFTGKAAVIFAHSLPANLRGQGLVTLVLPTRGSYAAYSPTAELDDTFGVDGEYQADTPVGGQSTLTCYAHEHSEAAEPADASWFNEKDVVDVIEVDPPAHAAAQVWTVNVESQAGNEIVIDSNLAGWVGTKRYRVVASTYNVAEAAQQEDAFMADTDDLRVIDSRGPYHYGEYDQQDDSWTAPAATDLPARYADEQAGDGVPLSTGDHRDLARFVNNFVSYKSTRHCPFVHGDGTNAYITAPRATTWRWMWTKNYQIQPFRGSASRKLKLALALLSDTGAEVQGRITVSLVPPVGSSGIDVEFVGAYQQLTFVTSQVVLSVLATQEVWPVAFPLWGWGYMSLELKATIGGEAIPTCYGVWEDWLGPLL